MERVMTRTERDRAALDELPMPSSAAPADVAGEPDPAHAGTVQVIFGAAVQRYPLAGLQVSRARAILAGILNVDPATPALVNGTQVRSTHRLAPDDTLELVRHAGEKGAGR